MGLVLCCRDRKHFETATKSWELRDLENEPSYHWSMTKKDAERTLKQQSGNRCYLTRYSEGRRAYRLSVMERVSSSKQIVKHFKFTITYQSSDENVYALKGNDKKFPKVSEMLQYFRNSAVSHQLSNIGVPVVYQTAETTNPDNEHRNRHDSPVEGATRDATSTGVKEVAKDNTTTECEVHQTASSCPDVCVPSVESLTIIKWTDKKGEVHKFELKKHISSKWFDIGVRLGQSMNTLENYKQQYDDNNIRMDYVFRQWIDNDGHPSVYPMTWAGVIELLQDMDMNGTANGLKEALEAKRIINKN